MAIAQKTLMKCASTRIAEIETNTGQMESDFEDHIDMKAGEAPEKILYNNESFGSKKLDCSKNAL